MPRSDGTTWDGVGLPPAAQDRLTRAADSQAAGSLLSVPDASALATVGFTPVGEVMGCIVEQVAWRGYGCGYGWTDSRTVASGNGDRWAGLAPYVQAVYHGWETALRRLLMEATALGADGVVGIQLTQKHLDLQNREFVALGTAVRGVAVGPRAKVPFTTDLNGTDVSKLLHAGWLPTGIAVGISAGVRHDDYRTRNQASWWNGSNTEITGYTDLVSTIRHDARTQFERRARAHGGEAVLVSSMGLHVWENEPSDNHTDHYAEASFIGTAATAFHRGATAPTSSLTVLPLNRTKENRR